MGSHATRVFSRGGYRHQAREYSVTASGFVLFSRTTWLRQSQVSGFDPRCLSVALGDLRQFALISLSLQIATDQTESVLPTLVGVRSTKRHHIYKVESS